MRSASIGCKSQLRILVRGLAAPFSGIQGFCSVSRLNSRWCDVTECMLAVLVTTMNESVPDAIQLILWRNDHLPVKKMLQTDTFQSDGSL